MRTNLTAVLFVAGSLLVPIMVHAAGGSDSHHPVNLVKDSAITTVIKTKLGAEHVVSLKHISVETDNNGVVWLGGYVHSRRAADEAEDIARNTAGIKEVRSSIAVRHNH